jgi:hypothetical protein
MPNYPAFSQRRVTVTTAATAIHGASPMTVRELTLRNGSLVDIILCDEAGTGLGITLEPSDTKTYRPLPGEERLYGLSLWAKCASTATLEVEEWR